MSRALNKLSARFVQTVTKSGRYSDGGSLYLSVSENGGRRWVFMFRWDGRTREMGLGSARTITLAKAREKAAEARQFLAEGRNPLEVKSTQRVIPTFGEVADALISSMESSWKNEKHRSQWRMTLSTYAAPLRPLKVDEIGTEQVLMVLRPIWTSKPETASRLRGRIEAVLDAARAQGFRSEENPARWRGHLDKLLPPQKKLSRGHHKAMPYEDIPAFMTRLRENPTVSNMALEMAILTAGRSNEVMGARWEEFDLVARVWRVPASRMKAGREHQVPLTPRMLKILALMQEWQSEAPQPFVFPSNRKGKQLSVMALTMALRRAGGGDFTVHGFRSGFRDWAGDKTSFPREVAEAALAHVLRDSTEAAYRRSTALEKRRELMLAWERYLNEDTSNIVALPGRKEAI